MKKRIFYFCVLMLIGMAAMLLCSCGAQSESSYDEYIEYTDALGREVRVGKNPVRVAALLGSFADIWMLSGGELCATAEDAWEDFGLELDAVNIGGAHSPSLELLVSSSPELVLASASTASNIDIGEAMSEMGVTVVYFDVDCFDDYLTMLDFCTSLTGRRDLYDANGLSVKREIENIKNELAESGLGEEKMRILLLRASASSIKAKGSTGTVIGEMLSDLGCVNIADSDRLLLDTLSVEAVIRNEPYRIFAVTMGADTAGALSALNKMLSDNPAWGTLEAVREGRVHIMEKRLFNLKPNARWGEAYSKLYEALIGE